MLNLIIGGVVLVLGIIFVAANWLFFFDVLKLLVFLGLIAFGIIACLAGIKQLKKTGAKSGENNNS